MTKIPNMQVSIIGILDLGFIWDLEIGIWDFNIILTIVYVLSSLSQTPR